jgi:hypothetical protein
MGINPPVSTVGNPLRYWVSNLDPFAVLVVGPGIAYYYIVLW